MSVQLKNKPAEGLVKKASAKCICGEYADLRYLSKLGRVKTKKVIVHRVPTYVCDSCGEQFMNGADSYLFAERVAEAVRLGKEEINF